MPQSLNYLSNRSAVFAQRSRITNTCTDTHKLDAIRATFVTDSPHLALHAVLAMRARIAFVICSISLRHLS